MKKIFAYLALGFTTLTGYAATPLWMRDIQISPDGTEIVFCYKGDIYKVPSDVRKKRFTEVCDRFGLTDSLNAPMLSYSHGMRQKIMVAAALVHNPDVWILDEPLIGLDPKSAFELKAMMREHADAGNCVFFSTHILEVAEKLCDKVIIIKKGKSLYDGTLDNLCSQNTGKSLEQIFLELTENE